MKGNYENISVRWGERGGGGRLKTGQWCPKLTVFWHQFRYKDQRREKSQRKGDLEARNQGN